MQWIGKDRGYGEHRETVLLVIRNQHTMRLNEKLNALRALPVYNILRTKKRSRIRQKTIKRKSVVGKITHKKGHED